VDAIWDFMAMRDWVLVLKSERGAFMGAEAGESGRE
jgi:hypothetical protein